MQNNRLDNIQCLRLSFGNENRPEFIVDAHFQSQAGLYIWSARKRVQILVDQATAMRIAEMEGKLSRAEARIAARVLKNHLAWHNAVTIAHTHGYYAGDDVEPFPAEERNAQDKATGTFREFCEVHGLERDYDQTNLVVSAHATPFYRQWEDKLPAALE